jgi:hypothetical protein
MIDHVDQVLVVQTRKEINLDFKGFLFTRSWQIELQRIHFVIFGAKINTNINIDFTSPAPRLPVRNGSCNLKRIDNLNPSLLANKYI